MLMRNNPGESKYGGPDNVHMRMRTTLSTCTRLEMLHVHELHSMLSHISYSNHPMRLHLSWTRVKAMYMAVALPGT
jgi:hypothetical protein